MLKTIFKKCHLNSWNFQRRSQRRTSSSTSGNTL